MNKAWIQKVASVYAEAAVKEGKVISIDYKEHIVVVDLSDQLQFSGRAVN